MFKARLGLIALLALVAGVLFSCKKDHKVEGPPVSPPNAPYGVYVAQRTTTTVTLHWQDMSSDEDGFRIYATLDTTDSVWTLRKTVDANVIQATIDSLTPDTTYYFAVTAFSTDGGESGRSATVSVRTYALNLPNAPTGIQATPQENDRVQISWHSEGAQDSFVVQRHDTINTPWSTIGTVEGTLIAFIDSSVSPSTHYYYRVGSKNQYGISWGTDSASVYTLPEGAPATPAGLTAEIHLGTGVTLTWSPVSHTATGIVIYRGISGHFATVIDTLDPSVTAYTDSLGQAFNQYFYQIRAFNQYGASGLSDAVDADYRLRSNGVIPLTRGNNWTYDVIDTAGSPYTEVRSIDSVLFIGGQDYYLLDVMGLSAIKDSLFLLRNTPNTQLSGCYMLHWPPLPSDNPQLFFRYPATQLGERHFVDGDSMVVVSLGQSKNVNGTVFQGLIVYEWYINPTFRIVYWVEPSTVGIVYEEHYTGTVGQPVHCKTLSLRSYVVLN